MNKNTHYEVRTDGDGEFDFFTHHPVDQSFPENDSLYDETDLESAYDYAEEVGGYVIEISERLLPSRNAK